jgi:hypothetical protein
MSTRSLVALTVVTASCIFWLAGESRAQEVASAVLQGRVQASTTLSAAAPGATPPQQAAAEPDRAAARIAASNLLSGRSNRMLALYASTVALQALDVHSTLKGLNQGAVEANPIMTGITAHRPVFIAVKAALACSTVIAAHRIAKRNKVAAAAMLIAVNGVYAYVVARNYRVASSPR